MSFSIGCLGSAYPRQTGAVIAGEPRHVGVKVPSHVVCHVSRDHSVLWLEGKSNMNSDISFFQSLCNTVECLTASAGLFIYPL
jgi:hypothetical protein